MIIGNFLFLPIFENSMGLCFSMYFTYVKPLKTITTFLKVLYAAQNSQLIVYLV